MINNKLIFLLFLFLGYSFSLPFPDTSFFNSRYKVSERKKGAVGFPTQFKNKAQTIQIKWDSGQMTQVTITQPKPFTDHHFSTFAKLFSAGAQWHETPLLPSQKKMLNKQHPGLEQQWILKGYGNESGWMGSGLIKNKFYLVFKDSKEVAPQVKAPLTLISNIQKYVNHSDDWLPTTCSQVPPKIETDRCYLHTVNSNFRIHFNKNDTALYELWVYESHPIHDIEDIIRSLPQSEYYKYARELPYLSQSETPAVLIEIAKTIPDFFNWPSWQFQKYKEGVLNSKDYDKVFNQLGNRWPHIPINHSRTAQFNMDIYLYFNGNYQLKFKAK